MFSLKSLGELWNRFFFRPQPTEGIALFRMVWFSLLLLYLLTDIPNISDFYGPHGILSIKVVRDQFNYPHLGLFSFFQPTYEVVVGVFIIYGMALLAAILGFHTRLAILVSLICLTSLHHRNIWLLSSSELLIRAITIILLCSPCGHSLSLDSWIGQRKVELRKPRDWAPWALRLIQIQLSVVYIVTVWQKLKGDSWIDGTAVYYATRLNSMSNQGIPFLLDNMFLLKLFTWGTLILEFTLGTLIWFRECRKPLLILGIFFHLGIEYTMSIPFFELVMIALLLNFVTPKEYRALTFRLRRFWGQRERLLGAVGSKSETA
jgi:hypothetical protein